MKKKEEYSAWLDSALLHPEWISLFYWHQLNFTIRYIRVG